MSDKDREVHGYGLIEPDEDSGDDDYDIFRPKRNFADVFSNLT